MWCLIIIVSAWFWIQEAIKNCIQKEDDWNSDRSCHKEVEMGESDTKEGSIIQVSNKVFSEELSPEWACRATKNQEAVKLNSHQDDEYFSSYDRFSVHYNMIAVRCLYRINLIFFLLEVFKAQNYFKNHLG